ncbi:hypothetical protein LTS08_006878 [Lithohypha guttulata]|nr:hypothetical protein LTS08_006878 [Lithohypha guttulata]
MQKRSTRSLQFAALLAATVSAQTITSTIPVCPTASSTTITLPTTVTFCPGPHCNGGASGPMITHGPGMPGVHLGQYTSVGPDGKTTVLGIYETVYDSLCETGLVPATWTVTHECPCTAAPAPTVIPAGFETTVVPCTVCGPHSSTVTLTQPCSTGPYAHQTPTVGQSGAAPMGAVPMGAAPASAAAASAAAQAAQAGPGSASASAGSGAGAMAQSGPNGASAQAGAGAGAAASAAPAGANTVSPAVASAGSGAGAGASAGPAGVSAGAGAGAGAGVVSPAGAAPQAGNKISPVNGTMPMNGTVKPVAASPVASPVQSFMSSATRATFTGFTILAAVLAAVLL